MTQRQQNRDAIRRLYQSNGLAMPQPRSKPGDAT
jgi:hypothetical protein